MVAALVVVYRWHLLIGTSGANLTPANGRDYLEWPHCSLLATNIHISSLIGLEKVDELALTLKSVSQEILHVQLGVEARGRGHTDLLLSVHLLSARLQWSTSSTLRRLANEWIDWADAC